MSYEFIKKVKLPLCLLVILLVPLMAGNHVPVSVKSISYALSLSMKSILEWLLPFIIFSFVFYCLANLQKGAVFFVFLLVSCIFLSNFTALMYGYSVGKLGLNFLQFSPKAMHSGPELLPYWHFHLTKLISNDTALLCGFFAGIFFSLKPHPLAKKASYQLNMLANAFLKHIFIPLLPIFILGFVFKLEYDQVLKMALTLYGPILVLVIVAQWSYLAFWYTALGGFSKKGLTYIKNVLPATLTGFSTISSAAAMPVLLNSTERNLADETQARMLVPAIINIHTIGSAIGIPILSLATLITFGLPMPSPLAFAVFAFYTALAKYAVAAVPGGVIIVVAPILEAHLGFNSDMVGLITAVYLICDPFGTAANVTANGAFPIAFTKLQQRLAENKRIQRLFALKPA
tara:strand:+ start:1633 stop:2838 length:1206 start_codon:yes stop_codon:yes gene_type:complete